MPLTASVCVLLSRWISFLLAAVPSRSRRTFVELLIGCMLNPEGWVTRAIGAICREAHWTTYYKLIERAHVSVADLSIRLLQLVQWVFPAELVNLIIDDTLVPRCAKSGPGISVSSMIRFTSSAGNTHCTSCSKRMDRSATDTCARSISL